MFRPKYPDIKRPEYGICGIHVRVLAGMIFIPLSVADLLGIVAAVLMQQYILLASCVLIIVIFLSVLAADKFEKPGLYLISLIWSVLATISGVLIIAVFTYQLINTEEAIYAAVIIIYVLTVVYAIIIFNVVRRARNYMIKEVLTGNVKQIYDRNRNHDVANALYI